MNRSLYRSRSMRLSAIAFSAACFSTLGYAQSTPAKPQTTVAPAGQPWKRIVIPPLHAFKPAQPKRIELSNGLVIFLQEDHELPFITGTILIRGGSRNEPDDKLGLVSIYGET